MPVLIRYSIILTVENTEVLPLSLNSLARQTIAKNQYEILIVDHSLNDAAWAVVDNVQKKYPGHTIKYFYKRGANAAGMKNLGIKNSRGEIIFFTDGDCVVSESWMEELLDGYKKHPDAAGVEGLHESMISPASKKYLQKYLDFLIQRREHLRNLKSTLTKTNMLDYGLVGRTSNFSYRKLILDEIGGFDENLLSCSGEDYDLKTRIYANGFYILFSSVVVTSARNQNFFDGIGESFALGKDFYYLSVKHPELANYFRNKFSDFFPLLCGHLFDMKKFFFAAFANTAARFIGAEIAKRHSSYPRIEKEKANGDDKINTFTVQKIPNGPRGRTTETLFKRFVPPARVTSHETFCSVVIPTYNRSHQLAEAIAGVVHQTLPPDRYEIIIIDDGSTDDTRQKILGLQHRYPNHAIRYFYQKNSGPAKARNRGIKEARGDVIFFTDDDATVPDSWLETLFGCLEKHPDLAGVGGWHIPPEKELQTSASARYTFFVELHSSFSPFPHYEMTSNDPLFCFRTFAYNTANVCYKKDILEKVGGFREDFFWPGSEDNDLAFRITSLGYSLLYIPFHVTHSKAMSVGNFAKLYFRRGANGYLLRKIHREQLEELMPGVSDRYGSIASFVYRFRAPEKFLAFLEWASLNAGIIYMKNKIETTKAASQNLEM